MITELHPETRVISFTTCWSTDARVNHVSLVDQALSQTSLLLEQPCGAGFVRKYPQRIHMSVNGRMGVSKREIEVIIHLHRIGRAGMWVCAKLVL